MYSSKHMMYFHIKMYGDFLKHSEIIEQQVYIRRKQQILEHPFLVSYSPFVVK